MIVGPSGCDTRTYRHTIVDMHLPPAQFGRCPAKNFLRKRVAAAAASICKATHHLLLCVSLFASSPHCAALLKPFHFVAARQSVHVVAAAMPALAQPALGALLLLAFCASASIVDVRYGDDGECFIIHSDGSGVWGPCPPRAEPRSAGSSRVAQTLSAASAKHSPQLRRFMDESLAEAASHASTARKLLSRSFNAPPADADSPPPLPAAAHWPSVDVITADELLTYTLSPHKPLMLLPWYPSCTTCNATASIVEQANKLLGVHALDVRAIRWEADGLWGSWLRNQSLLFMLKSSFQLPSPPITFEINGITWYSRGVGTTPTTEAPAPAEYPPLLNLSLPEACFHDADIAQLDSDSPALYDRRCILDTATAMSRALRLRLPVLCHSSACTLLHRCSLLPHHDTLESRCSADDASTRGSSDRLRRKLSLDGSYAFSVDDFLGGNYTRVKILFDDGGSSSASDAFRLFALLIQDESSPLDFALMGDPVLVSRFNAAPSSLNSIKSVIFLLFSKFIK